MQTLLIVEDDNNLLEGLTFLFENEGYCVKKAHLIKVV